MRSGKPGRRRRVVCIILACVLAGAALAGPVGMVFAGEQETSDEFYMRLYGSDDQIASVYKVTLTGTYSGIGSRITDVALAHASGDECETSFLIDGYTATVTLTHPIHGYIQQHFVLSRYGIFSGY